MTELYSLDNEEFTEDLAMILDVCEDDGIKIVYKGERKELTHADFCRPEYIIDMMHDEAWNAYGESANDYLQNLTCEDIKELKRVVCEFLDKKCKIDNL